MKPRKSRSFLDRPLRVLRCFSPNNLELTASEISEKAGLPKTTTHRILTELTEERLLEKSSRTKKYRIGPDLYILGSLYLSATDVLQVAEPVAQMLNDLTSETILMGIFDNSLIVITRWLSFFGGKSSHKYFPGKLGAFGSSFCVCWRILNYNIN